jgi:hypothetical protein
MAVEYVLLPLMPFTTSKAFWTVSDRYESICGYAEAFDVQAVRARDSA